jgi:DNA-directed RNA polymerase specialized sigma24 family protein
MGPAEAAAFRIDFSEFLASLPERRREAAMLLAEGRGTGEVAGQLGVSAAAVSQTRSYLEQRWREYIREPAAAAN